MTLHFFFSFPLHLHFLYIKHYYINMIFQLVPSQLIWLHNQAHLFEMIMSNLIKVKTKYVFFEF
jgi:hypothetical protein